MLRDKIVAAGAAISGKDGRRAGFSRLGGGAMSTVSSFLAFAIVGGATAESLAQPRDTSLEAAAAAYIAYREDVAALEATPIANAEAIREAHRRLAAHDSDALANGWVAYAALVAADTPEFRQSLQRELSGDDGKKKKKKKGESSLSGVDAFNAKMAEDPGYPRTLSGANAAIARVLAMTANDLGRVSTLGEAYKTQAYALQKTKWGMAKLPPTAKRIEDADSYKRSRSAAVAPTLASTNEAGVFAPGLDSAESWKSEWASGSSGGRIADDNAQVMINRVLALAAKYSVGATNAKYVETYAKNTKASNCLSLSALTLRQCIAATRAPYEEAFCVGEHGLNDVTRCLGWVAGVEPPATR
jgi:hypothetical protein